MLHCLVEKRSKLFPIRFAVVVQPVHFQTPPFTSLTAAFGPRRLRGDETGMAIEPATEADFPGQRARLARQRREDGLRDIFRQMSVTGLPHGGGIDQVDVTRDQFAKGLLGTLFHVTPEQLCVVRHALLNKSRQNQNRTAILHEASYGSSQRWVTHIAGLQWVEIRA